MNVELHQPPELGDLGASPLGGLHRSLCARCVDQLLSGISQCLGFIVVSHRQRWEKSPLTLLGSRQIRVIPEMHVNQNLELQASVYKEFSKTLIRERLGDRCFYLLPLHWTSMGYSHGGCSLPTNNCFLNFYSPLEVMNTSPVGFLNQVNWRRVLQVSALKVGVRDV